ncbi:MAG: DUF4190 domain-containing protein [Armatimonadota bacterium]
MTDINDQKPIKTSGFATASLVLGILAMFSCGLTALPGLIFGIISVIQIRRSMRSLAGWPRAMAGTIINAFMLAAFLALNVYLSMLPILVGNDDKTHLCSSNVKQIGCAFIMYMAENDSCLPPSDKWVDSLRPYIKNERILKCPSAKKIDIGYAMNENLSRLDENQMSDTAQFVLVFDAVENDSHYGGPELLPSPERHARHIRLDHESVDSAHLPVKESEYEKVNIFGFADGHSKAITKKEARTLIWGPATK